MTTPAASLQATAAPCVPRAAGIDVLRAAVTALVVFHHTALTYGAIGGWYYQEIPPGPNVSSLLLVLFCTTNQAWFMGLFFLLAGYYTPVAFERRGALAFLRGRLFRLGLPLVVYALLLHPLTVALARTAKGRSFVGAWVWQYVHARFEPGPLWFAQALLLFAAAYAAWRSLRPPRPSASAFPSDAALLGAALATGAAAFVLRLAWPVGVNVGFLQIGYFASYVVLFCAGCAAARARWLETVPEPVKRRWLRIGWIAFPLFPAVAILGAHVSWLGGKAEGGLNAQALAYAFWEPFVAWGFILGLLTLFERRFATPGRLGRELARRAYLVYIIHPPILVGVALAWRSIDAPALVKFTVTGSVACVACYLAAGLLLRSRLVARVV